MRVPRLAFAAVAATGALALSGCADDMYGPYGYGYGVYGAYGYGSPYGGYGYPYGGYYGGYDPFGWCGDSYYPGVGIYVYDRYRNRRAWNGDQQRYWTNRRSTWQSRTGSTYSGTRENWSGFNRTQGTTSGWRHRH